VVRQSLPIPGLDCQSTVGLLGGSTTAAMPLGAAMEPSPDRGTSLHRASLREQKDTRRMKIFAFGHYALGVASCRFTRSV